jgi:hypothetical protein
MSPKKVKESARIKADVYVLVASKIAPAMVGDTALAIVCKVINTPIIWA